MNKYLIGIFGMLLMLVPVAAFADGPQGATVNTPHANTALTLGTLAGGMTALAEARGLDHGGKIRLADEDDYRGERGEHHEWERYRHQRWGWHPDWRYHEWRENRWRRGYWGRGPSWNWGPSRCFWLLDPYGRQTEFYCG